MTDLKACALHTTGIRKRIQCTASPTFLANGNIAPCKVDSGLDDSLAFLTQSFWIKCPVLLGNVAVVNPPWLSKEANNWQGGRVGQIRCCAWQLFHCLAEYHCLTRANGSAEHSCSQRSHLQVSVLLPRQLHPEEQAHCVCTVHDFTRAWIKRRCPSEICLPKYVFPWQSGAAPLLAGGSSAAEKLLPCCKRRLAGTSANQTSERHICNLSDEGTGLKCLIIDLASTNIVTMPRFRCSSTELV